MYIARMISVGQPHADFLIPGPTTMDICREIKGDEFVATLPKTIESRGWKTAYRGKLFIHATTYDRRDRDAMTRFGLTPYQKDFVYGAVIGVVDLVDVTDDWVGRSDDDDAELPAWGQPGQFHWQPRNPIRLRSPVHCRGFQGIRWPVPHVFANVLSQLARAAQ